MVFCLLAGVILALSLFDVRSFNWLFSWPKENDTTSALGSPFHNGKSFNSVVLGSWNLHEDVCSAGFLLKKEARKPFRTLLF